MADYKDIEEAIIQKESSGRPGVVGDVGLPGGSSTGLMQIQRDTAKDMLKKKLLPREWKGKAVTDKDLPQLLKDPEFNRLAGAALFVDNKRRLRSVSKKRGGPVSEDMINDWAIKAHNQGLTQTIKREVRGEKGTLPSVDTYLQKVKSGVSRIQEDRAALKQEAQDLLAPPQDPIQENLGTQLSQPPPMAMPSADMSPNQIPRQVLSTDQPPQGEVPMGRYALGGIVQPYDEGYYPDPDQPTDEFSNSGMESGDYVDDSDVAPKESVLVADPQDVPEVPPEMSKQEEPVPQQQFLMDDSETVSDAIVQSSEIKAQHDAEPKSSVEGEVPSENTGLTVTEEAVVKDAGLDKQAASAMAGARESDDINVQQEYRQLMDEYKTATENRDEARKTHAKLGILDALSKASKRYASGKAQEAGGFKVETAAHDNKIPTIKDLTKGPDSNVLKGKLSLLKQYQSSLGKPTKLDTQIKDVEGRTVLINKQTGEIINDIGKSSEKENRLDTQIKEIGGRSLLINRQTGETIQDLGKVGEAPRNRSTQIIAVGDRQVLVDKNTGDVIKDLGGISSKDREGRELRKEQLSASISERKLKRRDRHEKVVMDTADKLQGIVGARSVYAKAVLRDSLVRDGLRVIKNIEDGEIVATEQVAEELATVLASALQGGNSATRESINGIIPHTATGSVASIRQYIESNPKTFINSEFLDHFKKQLEGQREFWGEELSNSQKAQYEKLRIIFNKKDSKGGLINKDLEDMFKRSMSIKNNADRSDQHEKIQKFADKEFGGNYSHAKKFLKERGDI